MTAFERDRFARRSEVFQQRGRDEESEFWEGEIKAVPASGVYSADIAANTRMAASEAGHTRVNIFPDIQNDGLRHHLIDEQPKIP